MAEQQQFTIKDDGGSRIQFVSDAPLETITGVTSHVNGHIIGDPGQLSSVKGKVSAQVKSIKTGIDLRDEHLRSDSWLDAKKYPKATFEVKKVTGAKAIKPNKSIKAKVHGVFTLHGVSHPVVADTSVRWVPLTEEMKKIPGMEGDVLMIQGSFKIKLTDYKVSVPTIVQLKVSDEIEVNVNLRAQKIAAENK
ncbi:MAG: YceI family protein [Myxococcales bacterium]|nr:MAG: YceI family protein [Myxococcales bacterium]